jgi:hypothetical protein
MTEVGNHAEEAMRQEILPKDQTGYVDQFWSGMFGTLCSFGMSESRLVWTAAGQIRTYSFGMHGV